MAVGWFDAVGGIVGERNYISRTYLKMIFYCGVFSLIFGVVIGPAFDYSIHYGSFNLENTVGKASAFVIFSVLIFISYIYVKNRNSYFQLTEKEVSFYPLFYWSKLQAVPLSEIEYWKWLIKNGVWQIQFYSKDKNLLLAVPYYYESFFEILFAWAKAHRKELK